MILTEAINSIHSFENLSDFHPDGSFEREDFQEINTLCSDSNLDVGNFNFPDNEINNNINNDIDDCIMNDNRDNDGEREREREERYKIIMI